MEVIVLTSVIIMHPTTDNELQACQRILLPYEFDWNPSNNLFEISSMEEEYRTRSNFHRYINIIESRIPITPPTIQCIDESSLTYFDGSMGKKIIGTAQELVVDRSISNVRVSITRSGYSTYVYKWHHWIIADLLASKWGIVLDKKNITLQSTTHYNSISALKTLTWW